MTKEDLYSCIIPVNATGLISICSVKALLDEFFSQNVVTPKGANRHPYADVLHAWIEGADIVASEDAKHNHDVSSAKSKLSGRYYLKKCIKPQEPVYEWQWLCTIGGYASVSEYLTEEELRIEYLEPKAWDKIEETKRVRQ